MLNEATFMSARVLLCGGMIIFDLHLEIDTKCLTYD